MMAVQRVQIPISFSYETTISGQVVVVPAVGSTVSIIDRNTGNPPTVFSGFAGGGTIASVVTDAGGNVPGYLVEGSYAITAAPTGSFSGATVNWEAVRGDGIENIYPGAVNLAALATAVAQALVPAGTLLAFGGTSAPAGYLLCDGSAVSQTTYANLFAVIGTTYNTGGESAGTFRLPDTRQRFLLGKAASGTGSTLGTYGGQIDHAHSVAAHTHPIPSIGVLSTMPGHNHPLGHNGAAQIGLISFGNLTALYLESLISDSAASFNVTRSTDFLNTTGVVGPPTWPGVALAGRTENTTDTSIGGATASTNTNTGGPTSTGTANGPFAVVNHIIKL